MNAQDQTGTLDHEGVAFSNELRLTIREWIALSVFTLALVLVAPALWTYVEPLHFESDQRMPYELSGDYWLYDRFSRLAASQCETLLIGDSVVWGQYVKRDETLSHYLNELAHVQRFANLGLDGVHPAALAGLLEYYAKGVTGKKVLLQCNPLWMSSARHDLQEAEPFRFNHPRLVPQFYPKIPCYKVEMSNRIGVVIGRHLPFDGWTNHLQQAYFHAKSIPAWTLKHPYENPLASLSGGLPVSDDVLRHDPVPWTKRATKQNFPWVDPATSFQWQQFQRAVEILERRGNRVFVLVGPFNEHMVLPSSLDGYRRIQQAIQVWLQEKRVAYAIPPALPSETYADASHPLAAGYEMLAREVLENPFFE
jgi:hypothetical protein